MLGRSPSRASTRCRSSRVFAREHGDDVRDEALNALLNPLRVERASERATAGFEGPSHRKRALVERVVRHARESDTIEGHATSRRVHYLTARSDLVKLVELGSLRAARVG